MARAAIGISGWVYPPWRGVFYPKGLRQREELAYASRRLSSIEVNGSFYSLQRPTSWQAWHDATPDDFVFSVKGPRFVTHIKRLGLGDPEGVDAPLANFFASGLLALGAKLEVLLWQLPPTLRFDPGLLDGFLTRLPRSTAEAAVLASRHDERMDGRKDLVARTDVPLRHAVEPRHPSWDVPEFAEVLRRHGVAAVLADTAGKWPKVDADTADFRYVRLHGDTELYVSGYDDAALDAWAGRVRGWLDAGSDTYVYFDNDAKVRAPFDALGLIARVDGSGPGADATAT